MATKNSLIESLHSVLSEPLEEETVVRSTGLFSGREIIEKKRPQEEITNGKISRTYRYNPILDTRYLSWPEMNLLAEKNLAKIVDDVLEGLAGKTVVSYRPEHYPFFGVQTARRGAKTILVDDRPITAVEDLINGSREYSSELAERAKKRWRERWEESDWRMRIAQPLTSEESEEHDRLMKLSEIDLMQTIARHYAEIGLGEWDFLSGIERNLYVYRWINGVPFHGKQIEGDVYQALKTVQPWFLESMARKSVRESLRPELISEDEDFSLVTEQLFSKMISCKIFNEWMNHKRRRTDKDYQEACVESLFQTKDPKESQRIRTNLDYKYGLTLGQVDIPDQSIDVLFTGWGLDYLVNSVDFAGNASRILKDNGVFVGYIKTENRSFAEPRWDVSIPELLKQTLKKSGFDDNVMVKKRDFNGVTSEQDVGLVYFARKSQNPTLSRYGFMPDDIIPILESFPKYLRELNLLQN